MNDLIVVLLLVGAFAAILGFVAWAGIRHKRGHGAGTVGTAFALADEIFAPTSHNAHLEIRVDEERRTPTPTPDKNKGDRKR